LAVTPATSSCLLVDGGIPVRVKENESVAANQVEAAVDNIS
jgi:hypothetical protein